MINLGNKKFKKLYKGDELVTQVYKGDELIYQDIEALYGFKFTINTAYGYDEQPDQTIPATFGLEASYTTNNEKFIVDWGDGNRQELWNQSVIHTYASHGEYQITIIPSVLVNSFPIKGWMRGLRFPQFSTSKGLLMMAAKIKSFDNPIPNRAFVCSFQNVSESLTGVKVRSYLPPFFCDAIHLESVPDDFFDKVEFYSPGEQPQNLASYCQSQFIKCGMYTNLDPFAVAKKWFKKFTDNIDTSACTSFNGTFFSTFEGCIKVRTIPADLFDGFNTSSGIDFTNMFSYTFKTGFAYHYSETRGNEIPEGLFDFLDTSNGTTFQGMFEATFQGAHYVAEGGTGNIPQNLFASLDTTNGTNFSNMFAHTFQGHGYNSNTRLVLDGLFDSIQTPNAQIVRKMFLETFEQASYKKGKTVAQGFFDGIDTSHCISVEGLFYKTFSTQGGEYTRYTTTETPIPADLFYGIDTSNTTDFTDMFRETFDAGMFRAGIPDLFSHLNTSSGVKFSGMFSGTFRSAAAPSIPDTLFSAIDTTNGTDFKEMFLSTFSNACVYSTTVTFPEHIFDFLDTSNATNMYGMFQSTFNSAFSKSTVAEIPATLFQNLVTTNVTDFRNIFASTFNYAFASAAPSIPAGLFSKLDVSNATYVAYAFNNTFYHCFKTNTTKTFTIPATLFQKFCQTLPSSVTSLSSLFKSTFFDFCMRDVVVTIPATLFAGMNTSNVTNFYQTFCETFQGINVAEIPLGLLGGFDFTSGTNFSDTFSIMFNTYTGSQMPSGQTITYHTVFNDIFDGMVDFSWANASNANQMFRIMLAKSNASINDASVGNASDILQHFNFIPNQRTSMFYGRTNLTDYATINDNWK